MKLLLLVVACAMVVVSPVRSQSSATPNSSSILFWAEAFQKHNTTYEMSEPCAAK
jgi:hypothetical protein